MNTPSEAPGDKAATTATPGQSSPLHRILVVDDDISVRQLNAEVLVQSGYQVDAAADGAAAWEILNTDSYDLLITDHNMPRLTGLELLKKLRAARMGLPAILISGAMPTEELSRNPSLQLAAMLLKPFSPEELLGTVEKVLRAAEGAPSHAVYFPVTPRAAARSQI
jgi:two-component system chemotaxis response regulator CheY